MTRLLKELLEYIEYMEVESDAEFGAGRSWLEIKKHGGHDGVRMYMEIEQILNIGE